MPSDSLFSLSLPEQIGQFFYIGLPGTELAPVTRAGRKVKPGGVIIFGRNVAAAQQLRGLLDGVRELLPIEPLVGIDQEGGLVDRLENLYADAGGRTIRGMILPRPRLSAALPAKSCACWASI